MSKKINFTLENDLLELKRIQSPLNIFFRSNHLSKDVIFSIELILEESLKNIISYGYPSKEKHEILVSLEITNKELLLIIKDDGKAFNPINHKDPDPTKTIEERSVGGLGVFLIKKMADNLNYFRKGNFNHLIIKKNLT